GRVLARSPRRAASARGGEQQARPFFAAPRHHGQRNMRAMPYLPAALAALAAIAASPEPPAGVIPPEPVRTEAFARFLAGRDALDAQRWTDAETEFRAATSLIPGLPLAHYG